MKTFVYIDGFNLYYAIRRTPYKWLDLSKLCNYLLPNDQVLKINYYTARVKARANDPQQRNRQRTYLRALRTIPHLEIVYGRFLSHPVRMPLADDLDSKVRVLKTEEKGSDVNLGIDLAFDGFNKLYEKAVVISNDSDLVRPIRRVRDELGFPIGIINPFPDTPSADLQKSATFIRDLREPAIKASQFPIKLKDSRGKFRRPGAWS